MTPIPDLSQPQRQSLWAVILLGIRTIRSVGIVQLLLAIGFIFTRAPSLPLFLGIVALIGLVLFAIAAIRWWRYTFALIGDEVIVNQGVLARQTLTVPLDRVQSVSLEQKLLHRIVSLVQVSLDTAGTEQAEFVIDAVDQPVAEALQRAVANHRPTATAGVGPTVVDGVLVAPAAVQPPPPEQELLQHSPKRIMKIALTEMPFTGLLLLAPILAFFNEFVDRIPFDLPDLEGTQPGWWLAWFIPLALLAGLVFSVLLNVVRVLLLEWDLKVTATGAGMRRNAGLLSKTSVAATISRIQRVTTMQRPLERSVALRSLHLSIVGQTQFVVPGCDTHQAERIRQLSLGNSPGVVDLPHRVSPKSVFLSTRNTALVMTVAFGVLFLTFSWWSLIVYLIVPWAWFKTRRQVRFRRWGFDQEAVADYHQFYGWQRHDLLMRKINGVTVRQGLFERKHDLATVRLQSAAGDITIGMIPVADARALRDHALQLVETDTRAWM